MTNELHPSMTINGAQYLELIRGGAANLNARRAEINDLNVFPVPDGDTGDNMYMTIRAGVSSADTQLSLQKVSSAIAHGMLLGARGNSGVILSRIFYGISEGFVGKEDADISTIFQALKSGIKEAYGAVSKPVEGTILTVYREAAEYVIERLKEGCSLSEGLSMLCDAAERSLQHTPELLEVLRQAGVVDSGGAGLLCILEGMKKVADGTAPIPTTEAPSAASMPDLSLFTEDSAMTYGYCTEFLLRLQNAKTEIAAFDMEHFRAELEALGDSVVAFKDGSMIKVHVHSFRPWEVLRFGQQYGEFLTMKIENMNLQHSGAAEEKEPPRFQASGKPRKAYATVAVATGDGIKEAFLSMGADAVIDGGRCSNPSASDFISAFETLNAETILVFPGDSNIILTAKQAGELYGDAKVEVVPCRSIGEIYATLSVLDTSSGDTAAILAELEAAMGEVVCGSVSRACRAADMNGVQVKENDYIGYRGNAILSDAEHREDALLRLAQRLGAEDFGVLLLICGKDADESEAARVYEQLTATYPRTEVIMMDGGQPIQDYILLLQ